MKKILSIVALLILFVVPTVFAAGNPEDNREQNIELKNITQEVVRTYVNLYIDKINKKPSAPALRITSSLRFTFESKKSARAGSGKLHTVKGFANFDFIGKDNVAKVGEIKFVQTISEDVMGDLSPKELVTATIRTVN